MILNSPYITGSVVITKDATIYGALLGPGFASLVSTASYNANSASVSTRITNTEATASSLTTASGSYSTRVTSLETASGSFSTRVVNLETTSSVVSGSYAAASASLSTRVTTAESTLNTVSSSYAATSASVSSRVKQIEDQYATTGSNTFTGTQNITNTTQPTNFDSTAALYTAGGLRVKGNTYVSSSLWVKGDLTVYGTQSINYITSSQLDISDNIINLNTAVPGVRFGGIAVYDSGSTGLTGSLLWDSQNNSWIYSNPSGSGNYDSAMVIMGPRNASALGNEQGLSCNYLVQGHGHHHTTSSMIFHDGSTTCFPSAIVGGSTACFASTICAGTAVFGNTGAGSYSLGITNNDQSNVRVRLTNTGTGGGIFSLVAGNPGASNAGLAVYDENCSSTRIYINSAGSVGIGTSSPSAPLHVNAGAVSTPRGGGFTKYFFTSNNASATYFELQTTGSATTNDILFSQGSTGNYGIIGYDQLNDTMRVYTSSNIRFKIDGSGIACFACQVCVPNIISTGTSGGRYATFSAPTNGGYITFDAGGTPFGDLGSYCAQYGTCDATTLLLGSRTGYALVLGTNSTERVRINSDGYVAVTGNQGLKCVPYLQGMSFGWNRSNGQGESMINWTNAGGGNACDLVFNFKDSTTLYERLRLSAAGTLYFGVGAGAYEQMTLCYSGYNGGSPVTTLMPSTVPGSGALTTFLLLKSNGLGTASGCNHMGLNVQSTAYLATCNGTVGIGTTGPDATLHVYCTAGSANALLAHFQNGGGGTAIATIKIGEGTPENQYGVLGHYGADNSFRIGNVNGNLAFHAGNSTTCGTNLYGQCERMTILMNGNVGIGTTSATSKLTILKTITTCPGATGNAALSLGTAGSAGEYNLINFGYDAESWQPAYMGYLTTSGAGSSNGALVFATRSDTTNSQPTERMRINCTGNVGIGTTNLSTEANLFLGNQGSGAANEGGQLVLQKGYSCSCATHLDNYADSFRVLVGTDTGSNGVHMLIDHKTRNACFYGQVQTICGINSVFNNGSGARYNFTSLNVPQNLVGICANNGILVIRDHTAGGTGAFLIDPNQGVICMASNIPATVAIAYYSSGAGGWCWCLTSGGVPRCLGYGFYGA